MKTAMQKLISELKCVDEFPMIYGIIKRAEHYLEKEKEQIIEAYEDGKQNGIDSITNVNAYIIGEYYYNKTYNQKVPPCSEHAFEEE